MESLEIPDSDPVAGLGGAALPVPGLAGPTAVAGQLSVEEARERLEGLLGDARSYVQASKASGTRAVYASAWKAYGAWCASLRLDPLAGSPPQLALYLTQRARDGLSVSSLRLAKSAIGEALRKALVPIDMREEALRSTMEGISRVKGGGPLRKAAPAVPDVLRPMLAGCVSASVPVAARPALLARNRAMLLVGFGAALRRSELVALRAGDVGRVPGRGLAVTVRRSKTDQAGKGAMLAIFENRADPGFCPAAAFEAWMRLRSAAADWQAAGDAGALALPLFCAVSTSGRLLGRALAGSAVAAIVKAAAAGAGLDAGAYSGHSLRRGLLTDAGERNASLADVMRHSRHKSVATALGYIESGQAWHNNVTEGAFSGEPSPPPARM